MPISILGTQYPYTVNVAEEFEEGWEYSEASFIYIPSYIKDDVFELHARVEFEPNIDNDIFKFCWHTGGIWYGDNYYAEHPDMALEHYIPTIWWNDDDPRTGTWSGTMKIYYDDNLLVTINVPKIEKKNY